MPIEHQLEALAAAVDAGKVRHVGLSNETAWGLMTFLNTAGEGPPLLPAPHNTARPPLLDACDMVLTCQGPGLVTLRRSPHCAHLTVSAAATTAAVSPSSGRTGAPAPRRLRPECLQPALSHL